jgi:protein SCO1/2
VVDGVVAVTIVAGPRSVTRRLPGSALVAVTVAVSSAGCDGERELVGLTRDPEPVVDVASVPDVSRDGESFRFVAAEDGLLVVFFGYTNCPDVCPTTLAELRRGIDELDAEDAERIDTVMVSIDPARDRDLLAEYVDSFVPQAHAVATDDEALLQQITLAFGVSYQVTNRPNGDVDVSHSDTGLFAVDDTGTLAITWPYGSSSDDIAGDLEQLLADRA